MRSSALVLVSADGRLLLQHRSADAPRAANQWGFFGGAAEADETPAEAAVREAREELGYRLADVGLALRLTVAGRELSYFIAPQDPFQWLALNEGQALGWFTLVEALALDLTEIARAALGAPAFAAQLSKW